MFSSLSDIQRSIVFDKKGKLVVRACPGSGKTYCVASRLAHRVANWKRANVGIATLSFTNVACNEIGETLKDTFSMPSLSYPHFLGTIDSFINNYIFLPHGHLVIGCDKRPILVGDPHGNWSVKKYSTDYDQYFDIVNYGLNDELIYPEIQETFFFGFNKIFRQDGSESQHAANLRHCKNKYWKLGYATQHDANYFAVKILEKYPQIAKALIYRFPEIIIDEAQDTNNMQMRILDILCQQGLQELILVGDPDQAIFEWNKAKPNLFKDKYEEWKANSVTLNENRRSSQQICNASFKLSTLNDTSISVNQNVKDFQCPPEILIFDPNNIQPTIDVFLAKCEKNNIDINPKNVAITCRSRNFVNNIIGFPFLVNLKWTEDSIITYPLLQAAYLFSNGLLKKAYKTLEPVLFRMASSAEIVTRKDIEKYAEKIGLVKYRIALHQFFKKIPPAKGELGNWIEATNNVSSEMKLKLSVLDDARTIDISNLFSITEKVLPHLNFTVGTVHSLKGETFEALLLFLKTRGTGRNYTTLLSQCVTCDDDEELRIVYVGITRPRKLLMLAVPNEGNREAWIKKLL